MRVVASDAQEKSKVRMKRTLESDVKKERNSYRMTAAVLIDIDHDREGKGKVILES